MDVMYAYATQFNNEAVVPIRCLYTHTHTHIYFIYVHNITSHPHKLVLCVYMLIQD